MPNTTFLEKIWEHSTQTKLFSYVAHFLELEFVKLKFGLEFEFDKLEFQLVLLRTFVKLEFEFELELEYKLEFQKCAT